MTTFPPEEMGGKRKDNGGCDTFHDFLGMNRGDPVQLAAAWAQGGGKRAAAEAAPEGEAEALASMGLSSGGHDLVLGNSNLGSVLLSRLVRRPPVSR
ncbi:uncharacterized protein [Elaeis guineensis]|uniref:uncharacterized protein isoform X2 n=1 Tax=Elaeis guineensis var. tenera TaxID=51953 RepID=UPI003C6D5CA5